MFIDDICTQLRQATSVSFHTLYSTPCRIEVETRLNGRLFVLFVEETPIAEISRYRTGSLDELVVTPFGLSVMLLGRGSLEDCVTLLSNYAAGWVSSKRRLMADISAPVSPMQGLMQDVAAFHKATDTPIATYPQIASAERQRLRIRLISEEVINELLPALNAHSLHDIADGIADAIYVLVGTALEYGIPLDRVWAAVQRANMAKVDPVTGKVARREDGKILKPAGWQPPNIQLALLPNDKQSTLF